MENRGPNESNSTVWLVFAFVVALVLIGVAVFGYFYFNPAELTKSVNKEKVEETSSLEAKVSIDENGFVPQVIKIKKNTKITWVNESNTTHQVASDPHPVHDANQELGEGKTLEPGEEFNVSFEQIGSFSYHDHYNPEKFTGVVIVE